MGKTHYTSLPIKSSARLIKALSSKAIDLIGTHTPWLAKHLRENPDTANKFLRIILDTQIRRQQKITSAIHGGLYMPYDIKGKIEGRKLDPESSGAIYPDHANAVVRGLSRIQNLPGLRQSSEVFERYNFNTAGDRSAATEFDPIGEQVLNDMKLALFQAFESMDSAGDARPDVVLNKEELDLPRQTHVDNWRNVLSSIGTLEQVGYDYYQKTKGMHPDERQNTSLFNTPDEERAAKFALARTAIQVRPDSTRIPFATGTGVSGYFRRLAAMFQTYASIWFDITSDGFALAGSDRQAIDALVKAGMESFETKSPAALKKAMSEVSKGTLAAMATLISFALFSVFGREIGQLWRQLYSNEPPTGPRLGNIARGANSPKELAWYLATSTAMLNPYYAEYDRDWETKSG
jgi:hypothetical protein